MLSRIGYTCDRAWGRDKPKTIPFRGRRSSVDALGAEIFLETVSPLPLKGPAGLGAEPAPPAQGHGAAASGVADASAPGPQGCVAIQCRATSIFRQIQTSSCWRT